MRDFHYISCSKIFLHGIRISYFCWIHVRPSLTFHRNSEIVTHISYYPRENQWTITSSETYTVPTFGSISLGIKVSANWVCSQIICPSIQYSLLAKTFQLHFTSNALALQLLLYHKQWHSHSHDVKSLNDFTRF